MLPFLGPSSGFTYTQYLFIIKVWTLLKLVPKELESVAECTNSDSELLPSPPLPTHTLTSVSLCPPVPITSLTCPSQRLLTHPQKLSLTSTHKESNAGTFFSHLLLETSPRVLRCKSLIQVQYSLLKLFLQSPSTPEFR